MNVAELYRRGVDEFTSRVHAVGSDQWALPTPCPEWSVRELVNHVVAENCWAPPLLAGAHIADVGDRFDGDLLGDDPIEAWDRAAAEAVDAVRSGGDLRHPVHLSAGETTADEYVWQLFADHLVHAWDLARATGTDDRLPDDLVDACGTWFAAMEEHYRAAGAIGARPDLPPEADAQERLLAAFGRQV